MKKEPKSRSVVTLPLKPEKWQMDLLDKRFSAVARVYNACVNKTVKQYQKMIHDPRYREQMQIIKAWRDAEIEKAREASDADTAKKTKAKKKKKTSAKPDFIQDAYKIINDLRKEYDLTEYGMNHIVTAAYQIYKCHIPSVVAGLSIAKTLWSAWDDFLFEHNGDHVRYDQNGIRIYQGEIHHKPVSQWRSVASDNLSGIRLVDADHNSLECGDPTQPMFVYFGVPKNTKMYIPIIMPKNDLFKAEMIKRKIKMVRIVRDVIKGSYRYSVQFVVEGAPAAKVDKYGQPINRIGNGEVQININTVEVTVATKNDLKYYSLYQDTDKTKLLADKQAEIQQYLDRSRRLSNPDNFNEDGTVKHGIMENGKRRKLRWTYSNNYKKARAQLADLRRIDAVNRKLFLHRLTNEIITLGDTFYINDFDYKEAQHRKRGDKLTKKGTPAAKSKAGKIIANTAPATFQLLLEQKIKARGGTVYIISEDTKAETLADVTETVTEEKAATKTKKQRVKKATKEVSA